MHSSLTDSRDSCGFRAYAKRNREGAKDCERFRGGPAARCWSREPGVEDDRSARCPARIETDRTRESDGIGVTRSSVVGQAEAIRDVMSIWILCVSVTPW